MNHINRKVTNNISMVYGFKTEEARYSLIATLHTHYNKTKIYGLLSRESLNIKDFISFWKFIQKTVKTKFIEFEVIKSDAKVYKHFLDVKIINTIKTFNGYEAEQLLILTKQKMKLDKW